MASSEKEPIVFNCPPILDKAVLQIAKANDLGRTDIIIMAAAQLLRYLKDLENMINQDLDTALLPKGDLDLSLFDESLLDTEEVDETGDDLLQGYKMPWE